MLQTVNHGESTIEFEVLPSMTATLEGKEIHAVCSTFWLVYYAEVASRRAIERFFEEGENAVGASVALTHLAMAAVGATVVLTARVTDVQGRRVRCSFAAYAKNTNTLLAEGIQDQVVMRTEVLISKVAAAVR